MKLVIDALGAPDASGGMYLYARELISALAAAHPQDSFVVLGGPWSVQAFRALENVSTVSVDNRSTIRRIVGQFVQAALTYYRGRADCLLSISPIVSPLVPASRRVCVVHDWRHLKNPTEFSTGQRLYRRLWAASAARAGRTIVISRKTDRESAEIVPRARRVVIENGHDHLTAISPATSRPGENNAVITYGHHNNKRPELVIDAYAHVAPEVRSAHPLVVLGARGEYASELRTRAESLGVSADVSLPGFISDERYEQLVSSAACIVLASTDEGFGLPVAEAQTLGIPAVVTDDSGVAEIFPRGPLVVGADPTALSDGIARALTMDADPWEGIPRRSWREAAADVRRTIEELLSSRP